MPCGSKKQLPVNGFVAPGYEPVREAFAYDFEKRWDNHGQLCVYVAGELVVDIWYSNPKAKNPMLEAKQGAKYGPDSQQLLFSAGKTIGSYGYAIAVSKGLVTYDQLVMRDWPEFGSDESKKQLTAKEVLQHRSGLQWFSTPASYDMMIPAGIKAGKMAKIFEEETQQFPKYDVAPTSRANYHRQQRDNMTGEVVRKALAQQGKDQTFGEWMEENMMKPLAPNDEGKPEVWCGFRGDKMKVAHPDDIMFKGLLSGMCPKSFGRKAHNSIGELIANGRGQMEWNAQGCPEKGSDFAEFNPLEDYSKMIELLHTGTKMIDQECISCTSSASARGLAKIAAMVANGGTFDGVEYISPEVWDEMHSEEYTHAQGGTGFVCSYTKGGLFVSQSNDEILKKCPEECKKLVGRNEQILSDGREGYYGWYGSGGPAIGHHKELKIGFGYVPNTLEMYDGYYRKTAEIQRAIKNCALAQNQKKI